MTFSCFGFNWEFNGIYFLTSLARTHLTLPTTLFVAQMTEAIFGWCVYYAVYLDLRKGTFLPADYKCSLRGLSVSLLSGATAIVNHIYKEKASWHHEIKVALNFQRWVLLLLCCP